jgi:hypothetical protein
MSNDRPRRILVVTDQATPTPALLREIRNRSDAADTQFRLVVVNPARAELHLLHPERHDKAAEAEATLRAVIADVQQAAGGPVIGSVSIRHDPMDVVEETVHDEPVDEVILALPEHRLAVLLHQDLPHRLARLGIPIGHVPEPATPPA